MAIEFSKYEYNAILVPLTAAGLVRANRMGDEGWRLMSIHPLTANLGEAIDHDGQVLLVFERVFERDFAHLMEALRLLLENITINTSQD